MGEKVNREFNGIVLEGRPILERRECTPEELANRRWENVSYPNDYAFPSHKKYERYVEGANISITGDSRSEEVVVRDVKMRDVKMQEKTIHCLESRTVQTHGGNDHVFVYAQGDTTIDLGKGNDEITVFFGNNTIDMSHGNNRAIFFNDEISNADTVLVSQEKSPNTFNALQFPDFTGNDIALCKSGNDMVIHYQWHPVISDPRDQVTIKDQGTVQGVTWIEFGYKGKRTPDGFHMTVSSINAVEAWKALKKKPSHCIVPVGEGYYFNESDVQKILDGTIALRDGGNMEGSASLHIQKVPYVPHVVSPPPTRSDLF
jgi:hypothetical protein